MGSNKVIFAGHGGELAARLDMPQGEPRACALFAHCFTCSKDIAAASAIAQTLADLGIAVLRFDFTGLGHSAGEFSNTNFSSNVMDLVAAADFMRENIGAPQILIGHSLGGAAVIAAAARIPESEAVVTIGAPADPSHVLGSMHASLETIEKEGSAQVTLAGRSFEITRQFVEDISMSNIRDALGDLGKALLVLHAPGDSVVGIDNASDIFTAAKHPKSFVSLDGADHLLSRSFDAEYVAEVIAAWVSRYVPLSDTDRDDQVPEGVVRITESEPDGLLQRISVGGKFHLVADEPIAVGGSDLGPSPYQFLSTALGACTAMTIRLYARRKSIPLAGIEVDVSHSKSYSADSEGAEAAKTRIDLFQRLITLQGNLDDATRQRLLEIADKCPVHRTLENVTRIETRLGPSQSERAGV